MAVTTANAVWCEAIKDSDGLPCTYKSKETINGIQYCGTHAKIHNKVMSTVKDKEPWVKLGLIRPYEANGAKIVQKIRRHLIKGPKPTDGAGRIYIYYLKREHDQKPELLYWKIGVTDRCVKQRMKEWRREKNQSDLVLHSTYELSRGQKHVERLIQCYLAYCRMTRYPFKDGFHSTWYLDPDEVIKDGQERPTDSLERLSPRGKLIEWFCAPLAEILEVVEPLSNLYKL